ncbi:spore germination protein [Desulfofarcimen acetoxidans DSM 771]|uniref:Spore germination protein n=1 Tax=Desulfofarcimen acetoxidans (strain ATCC 49208 / DSM 771 / KCTC 5769 / VKM B-1644 / 5575) TaxID=485916 RepID=C8W5U5_DESAS|nr:endospore germination permease [Desulfofarcimen acetoxidans]ACV64095.1 spore germination protein [Desulfofarcimen acetoxidans DSM 771]
MSNKQHISEIAFTFLIIGFLIGTAIMLVPSAVISDAKQDAWLSVLIAVFPSIIIVNVLISLQRMFPGQSIIQYSVQILGYPFGKIINGLLLWFVLHLSVLVLRDAEDFVQLLLLPRTPPVLIAIVIVIVTFGALIGGFEVLARITVLIMPILLIFFLVLSFLSLLNADFSRITPINENGYIPIIRGAIEPVSFPFGEMIIFAFLFFNHQNINKSRNLLLHAVFGILVAFIVLEVGVLRSIFVLGVESSGRYLFPVLGSTFMSLVGNIFAPIVTINWFCFMFIKFAICYYAFNWGLANCLGIQNYRSIMIPIGILIIALSFFVYSNYVEEISFASEIWPYYAIPFEYGIPLLLWAAAKARN